MTKDFLNIVHQYGTSTGLFKRMVEPIPPERWFAKPGDDSNHLMWVAGHLLHSRTQVLKTLGIEYTTPWAALFARGAKQVDPTEYPKPEEIVRAWDEVSARLSAALENVSEEQLAKQAPPSPAPQFDGKVSGLIAFLSLHEAYHIGQAGFLKKWLGYGQTVG